MLSNRIIIGLIVILINIARLYGDPFCRPVAGSGKNAVAFEMGFLIGEEYFIKCSEIESLWTDFIIINRDRKVQPVAIPVTVSSIFKPTLLYPVSVLKF